MFILLFNQYTKHEGSNKCKMDGKGWMGVE